MWSARLLFHICIALIVSVRSASLSTSRIVVAVVASNFVEVVESIRQSQIAFEEQSLLANADEGLDFSLPESLECDQEIYNFLEKRPSSSQSEWVRGVYTLQSSFASAEPQRVVVKFSRPSNETENVTEVLLKECETLKSLPKSLSGHVPECRAVCDEALLTTPVLALPLRDTPDDIGEEFASQAESLLLTAAEILKAGICPSPKSMELRFDKNGRFIFQDFSRAYTDPAEVLDHAADFLDAVFHVLPTAFFQEDSKVAYWLKWQQEMAKVVPENLAEAIEFAYETAAKDRRRELVDGENFGGLSNDERNVLFPRTPSDASLRLGSFKARPPPSSLRRVRPRKPRPAQGSPGLFRRLLGLFRGCIEP